jgi:hypothetical protein
MVVDHIDVEKPLFLRVSTAGDVLVCAAHRFWVYFGGACRHTASPLFVTSESWIFSGDIEGFTVAILVAHYTKYTINVYRVDAETVKRDAEAPVTMEVKEYQIPHANYWHLWLYNGEIYVTEGNPITDVKLVFLTPCGTASTHLHLYWDDFYDDDDNDEDDGYTDRVFFTSSLEIARKAGCLVIMTNFSLIVISLDSRLVLSHTFIPGGHRNQTACKRYVHEGERNSTLFGRVACDANATSIILYGKDSVYEKIRGLVSTVTNPLGYLKGLTPMDSDDPLLYLQMKTMIEYMTIAKGGWVFGDDGDEAYFFEMQYYNKIQLRKSFPAGPLTLFKFEVDKARALESLMGVHNDDKRQSFVEVYASYYVVAVVRITECQNEQDGVTYHFSLEPMTNDLVLLYPDSLPYVMHSLISVLEKRVPKGKKFNGITMHDAPVETMRQMQNSFRNVTLNIIEGEAHFTDTSFWIRKPVPSGIVEGESISQLLAVDNRKGTKRKHKEVSGAEVEFNLQCVLARALAGFEMVKREPTKDYHRDSFGHFFIDFVRTVYGGMYDYKTLLRLFGVFVREIFKPHPVGETEREERLTDLACVMVFPSSDVVGIIGKDYDDKHKRFDELMTMFGILREMAQGDFISSSEQAMSLPIDKAKMRIMPIESDTIIDWLNHPQSVMNMYLVCLMAVFFDTRFSIVKCEPSRNGQKKDTHWTETFDKVSLRKAWVCSKWGVQQHDTESYEAYAYCADLGTRSEFGMMSPLYLHY